MRRFLVLSALGTSTTPILVDHVAAKISSTPTLYTHEGAGIVEHHFLQKVNQKMDKQKMDTVTKKQFVPGLGTFHVLPRHLDHALSLVHDETSEIGVMIVGDSLFKSLPEHLVSNGYENAVRANIAALPHALCISSDARSFSAIGAIALPEIQKPVSVK